MRYPLRNTGASLSAVLGGAVSANEPQVAVTYEQGNGKLRGEPSVKMTTMNGATAVTILKGTGVLAEVSGVSIYNADTAAVTVTVTLTKADGTSAVLANVTLQTLESLIFNEDKGWYALDANGAQKSSGSASNTDLSTLTSKVVSAALAGSVNASGITSAALAASVDLSVATSVATALSVTNSKLKSDSTAGF